MVQAGNQSGRSRADGAFDAEDFLGLGDASGAAPSAKIHSLPPIVTPPVYDRNGPNRMARIDPAKVAPPSRPASFPTARASAPLSAPQPLREPEGRAVAEGPTPIVSPPVYDTRGRVVSPERLADIAPLTPPAPAAIVTPVSAPAAAPEDPELEALLSDFREDPRTARKPAPVAEAAPIVEAPAPAPLPRVAPPTMRPAVANTPVVAPAPAATPLVTPPSYDRQRRPVAPATFEAGDATEVFDLPEPDRAPQPRQPQPPVQVMAPQPAPARTPVQSHSPDLNAVAVHEPMSVRLQGAEMRTSVWTVNGFTLTEPYQPRPGQGRVFDVTLLIGKGVTRIEMRVQVRAEAEPGQPAQQFIFVDLDRAQAEMLHRIVDQVVADHALSLTRLINDTTENRQAQHQTGERMRRFRTGFQLSLAGLALATAGAVALNSFTSVPARYAAVTVGATSIAVPVAGTVSSLRIEPGQRVALGDVLGYVRPSDFERRALNVLDRRRALEAELADLQARRTATGELASLSVAGAEGERSRQAEALQLAERRVAIERQQLAALRAGGLPTAERQRQRAQQEARVLEAESDLLRVRTDSDRLGQVLALAPMGILGGEIRPGTTTLAAMDQRIASLQAELQQMAQGGLDAELGAPILSPCDCTVQTVSARAGEWAEPDQPLALLTGGEAATIHALVMAEEARHLDLGDRALVELADGTRLEGRVSQFNYNPHWRGFAGLQDNVFAADRYARVEITTEQPLRAPAGMVADVSIQTSALWGFLRAQVGGLLAGLSSLVGL